MPAIEFLSLERAKQRFDGPLTSVLLDWLMVIDRVAHKDNQATITSAD